LRRAILGPCLASGGGQQGPVLAAAGAHVTVFDNSPRQLAASFVITGFYEDSEDGPNRHPLADYSPIYIATRAVKPC